MGGLRTPAIHRGGRRERGEENAGVAEGTEVRGGKTISETRGDGEGGGPRILVWA